MSGGQDDAAEGAAARGYDDYLGRLVKLIPSEIIALYLVGQGLIPADAKGPLLVWTLFCCAGVFLVRLRSTRDEPTSSPQMTAVLISAISFGVWVYSMGHIFQMYALYVPYLGSLLVLAWTFLVPYLYEGD